MTPEFVVVNINRRSTVAERVSIAGTSAARRKGLLGVEDLAPGVGLWLAPCEAIHTFGMKAPIDAIFLDHDYFVRKLRVCLPPKRIAVCLFAASVLELAAGTAARTGTAVGHRLRFDLPRISEERPSFCR